MSVVEEIKARLDIVEVISSYIPLQKSGRNYKALCPFHSEKTPSFVVFPESQRWHCFGACSEGGDVFTFVMKKEGWDFRTALEELARRAGVELRPRTPQQAQAAEETARLRELLAEATRYYHHLLQHAPEAERARAYVSRRGLNADTVARFQLGYSLPRWDGARDYLTAKGYTVAEQVKAGLLVRREDKGTTYDRFRDRLMIPIRDGRGRVIGFGARTLDPDGKPKYLNSPQTPLFDKSHVLFGFDLARQAIGREERVVIVEGYMDVMQAHQAGFENVVAQMGTALTEPQLRQLQRYTKRLVLALDPDAAGVQATLRGVAVAQETLAEEWTPVFDPRGLVGYEARLGAEIRILRLPQGYDPDDLIRQSPRRWAELVETALPVVDFLLQVMLDGLDLNDSKAKAGVVDRLLPTLRAVANPVEREDYVQKIARALQVPADAIRARLRGREWQMPPRRRTEGKAARREPSSPDVEMEGHCLAVLLQRPPILGLVNRAFEEQHLEPVRGDDFRDVASRVIFETWAAVLGERRERPLEELRARLPADLHVKLNALLTTGVDNLADEQLLRDLALTVLRLRERRLKALGRELRDLTIEAQEAGDIRAERYIGALRTYREMLLRTQQALAQRWSWGQV